ncbi:hypothetical protein BV898_08923 [Hypsibius exemplaris]|uniref:F-box domain-containing protein n=1 Tax=Hypsibius exemplaris TaxID=2072580 RepID=A0A1W0WP45_HYPEX|nr:hypothetical protein BV898_08923 [Hypsibius exemplaris]
MANDRTSGRSPKGLQKIPDGNGKQSCPLARNKLFNGPTLHSSDCPSREFFLDFHNEMPPKRIRLSKAGSVSGSSSSETTLSTDIKWVPPEDMKDLFRYCDLPTRCKLRRTCHYWQHLVSRKDVNEVAIVDDSCLFITSKDSKTRRKRTRCSLIRPGEDCPESSANLQAFRRNGLMGEHVRAIIFSGNRGDFLLVIASIIHRIGMFCTQVQRIVLWRSEILIKAEGSTRNWMSRILWAEPWGSMTRAPGFPLLTTLTYVNTLVTLSVFGGQQWFSGVRTQFTFVVLIPRLEIDLIEDTVTHSLDAFLWPYPGEAQQDWVGRYAPLLPNIYHEFAAAGFLLASSLEQTSNGQSRLDKIEDLRTADYRTMRPCLLRILAAFILHGDNLGFSPDPPPYPFNDCDEPDARRLNC